MEIKQLIFLTLKKLNIDSKHLLKYKFSNKYHYMCQKKFEMNKWQVMLKVQMPELLKRPSLAYKNKKH